MPFFHYVLAIILGSVFGWVFVRLYSAVAGEGTTRAYWTAIGRAIRGLLYGEDEHFWQHYFSVISLSLRYVGRQLLAVSISVAPVAVFTLMVVPEYWPRWHKDAPVAVIPATAGNIASVDPASNGITGAVFTTAAGEKIRLANRYANYVVCASPSASCYLMLGLGFENLQANLGVAENEPFVIVRPYHDDWNPLWPYLNDPEFLFFLSLSVTSVAYFSRRASATKGRGTTHGIGTLDFFLTEIAVGGRRFFRRVGDWETHRFAAKIANCPVESPVFIAGLARSGTTILLEKMAALDGVATHRYRDFPFILTPILWNRFLSLFGTGQQALERPHKDTIKITRDSPDAFEEPLWQFFFDTTHDGETSDVLDEKTSNPEFEKFYCDHVQKILYLRRGTRYVSKGNYNLTRIRYIDRIFEDARIVVPIRHPLTHIQSLVRQHRQFLTYADDDPRVPEYMQAAGHYEFGRQRMPIVTTNSNAASAVACWKEGRDAEGYAWQWRDVYSYVYCIMRGDPAMAAKLRVVRYEDLCTDPEHVLERLLRFIDLPQDSTIKQLASGIAPVRRRDLQPANLSAECWSIVEGVATLFGYSEDAQTVVNSQWVL